MCFVGGNTRESRIASKHPTAHQLSSLNFANTECPPIYRDIISDFWTSVEYLEDVNGARTEAMIQDEVIEIIEDMTISILQLNKDHGKQLLCS